MILLMGLPGSGKGTQGKMLADEHGFHLISMGDLVRMYVTGHRRQRMLAGELLDDAEIIAMLDRVLSEMKNLDDDDDLVLDGFPRTIPQAQWLLDQVKAGRFSLNGVVYLTASTEAVTARLTARGRLDDQEEVMIERFKEYKELTEPVVNWFSEQGVTVLHIDGERSTRAVNRDIVSHLNLLPE